MYDQVDVAQLGSLADKPARRTTVRWKVVAVLFFLSFLTIIDRICISAAKNDMAVDLSLSDTFFGWVFGAFALGYAVLMIPSGWLADRFGPRRFLALIVLLWSVFTLSTGLVNGAITLVAVRLLFGMAEAGAYPTAARAIFNWMPVTERGLSLGLLNTGSRLGAAIGLALMSVSTFYLGWRLSFALLGVAGFAWATFWVVWFRDYPGEKPDVSESELTYIRASRLVATAEKGGWQALLKLPNAYLVVTQYFASNFTFFICFSWLLPYVRDTYHLDGRQAGLYASIPLYFGAVATWLGGYAVDVLYRKGRKTGSRRIPAIAGFGIAAITLLLAGSMTSGLAFVICFAFTTLGVDLTLSPSWTTASDIGREYTGTLSAAMNTVGSLGAFASSVMFPYLLNSTGGVKAYFYLAAGLDLAAIGCWLLLKRSAGES